MRQKTRSFDGTLCVLAEYWNIAIISKLGHYIWLNLQRRVMIDFDLFDKSSFHRVRLNSVDERRRLSVALNNTNALNEQELLAELANLLNPTSFRKVLNTINLVDPRLLRKNQAESFTKGFASNPLPKLPEASYLQLVVENLNTEIDRVTQTMVHLDAYRARVVGRATDVIAPIKELVDLCGYSKIALMKLFQLEVFSYNLSKQDRELKGGIYVEGKVRGLGDTLMIIDQSIQPRGRAFRSMISYSKQIDFGENYYKKYKEAVSDCFCPFPITEDQVASFVRTLSSLSVADQAVGLIGLARIGDLRGWEIVKQIYSSASRELQKQLAHTIDPCEERCFFEALLPEGSTDYDIYNAAIANRDFPATSTFRNNADLLLLPRISNVMKSSGHPLGPKHLKEQSLLELSSPDTVDSQVSCAVCSEDRLKLSSLLRFLDFRKKWPTEFQIGSKALSIVIENGMPLHRLLTDVEVEKIVLKTRKGEDRLAVLMLRYFPVIREFSEDADYLFLRALEDASAEKHSRNLVDFLEELSSVYPKFATGLILALTPRRLQKCYKCISGYSDMNLVHRRLLEIAAKVTGDLDLIIQADQIALDEKLASARAHFDSSRIFVDEVLFKNWALEEVSPSFQALRKHVFLYSPTLPENPTTDEIAASMNTGALNKIVNILKEHFLDLPVKDAFRTFCLDHYFGVDSFLGRRIRHNATHGVLLGQMDRLCMAAIDKDPQAKEELKYTFESWRRDFLQEVDALVNDRFRFKTKEFPQGLLTVDFEAKTKKFDMVEMDLISQTIVNSKPDIVIQNMIAGFWGLLEPELKKMRQYLKTEFSQLTLAIVDRHFNNLSSPSRALAADLRVTLMERIERLSSWYSPFSPADISISLTDLAQMVWTDAEDFADKIELVIYGNAKDAPVVGGNVRTLFDCLHVVLVNAGKHSDGNHSILLEMFCDEAVEAGVQELNIVITSSLSRKKGEIEENEFKYKKMSDAITKAEISKQAMVVQGYSGLRKLKYLLFRSQRSDTLKLEWNRGKVSLRFNIPINFLGNQPHVSTD